MLDQLHKPPKPRSRAVDSILAPSQAGSNEEPFPASRESDQSIEEALGRKTCVVEFRSGEAVIRHPDLKCFLEAGWLIESAVPLLAGARQVELLVVLSKSGVTQEMTDEDAGRPNLS